MLLASRRSGSSLVVSRLQPELGKAPRHGTMHRDQQNRHELEHLWKMRADNAKARLDRAAESLEELSENPETLSQTDPDTHNNAVRVYTEALEEFTNISRFYQDLVLHGTVPEEEQRRINAGHGTTE